MKTPSGRPRRFPLARTFQFALLTLAAFEPSAAAGTKHKAPDLSSCGGNSLAQYIGKPTDELRKLNSENIRFVCAEHCATTAEFRSARLTVIYSKTTNSVTRLSCG
jgi:hypothetical protein